jgi:hypothetical protein
MRDADWSPLDAILEAITSVVGWACVIAGTMVTGFCRGYWIGHREVMGPMATLTALAWVPLVWLGQPAILISYGVTALAFYLPIRLEFRWLHIGAVIATFLAWLIVVAMIVEATSHGKFWQW